MVKARAYVERNSQLEILFSIQKGGRIGGPRKVFMQTSLTHAQCEIARGRASFNQAPFVLATVVQRALVALTDSADEIDYLVEREAVRLRACMQKLSEEGQPIRVDPVSPLPELLVRLVYRGPQLDGEEIEFLESELLRAHAHLCAAGQLVDLARELLREKTLLDQRLERIEPTWQGGFASYLAQLAHNSQPLHPRLDHEEQIESLVAFAGENSCLRRWLDSEEGSL